MEIKKLSCDAWALNTQNYSRKIFIDMKLNFHSWIGTVERFFYDSHCLLLSLWFNIMHLWPSPHSHFWIIDYLSWKYYKYIFFMPSIYAQFNLFNSILKALENCNFEKKNHWRAKKSCSMQREITKTLSELYLKRPTANSNNENLWLVFQLSRSSSWPFVWSCYFSFIETYPYINENV